MEVQNIRTFAATCCYQKEAQASHNQYKVEVFKKNNQTNKQAVLLPSLNVSAPDLETLFTWINTNLYFSFICLLVVVVVRNLVAVRPR